VSATLARTFACPRNRKRGGCWAGYSLIARGWRAVPEGLSPAEVGKGIAEHRGRAAVDKGDDRDTPAAVDRRGITPVAGGCSSGPLSGIPSLSFALLEHQLPAPRRTRQTSRRWWSVPPIPQRSTPGSPDSWPRRGLLDIVRVVALAASLR
jgi:hypothetical protein